MRRTRKNFALILVVAILIGSIPISLVSNAETATTQGLSEALVFEDDFSGSDWASGWLYDSKKTEAGSLDLENGTAPLGGSTSTGGNFYYDATLTDVHVQADVCVTKANCRGGSPQYHLLLARSTNVFGAYNAVAFGFVTKSGATQASLTLGYYPGGDGFQAWYTTDVVYDFNKEYALELFVVDNFVMAKCDGETVFTHVLQDGLEPHGNMIQANGYCAIVDQRSKSTGDNPTKGGYFDDFSVSSVSSLIFDGFEVNGSVIVDKTGTGVADITLLFEGEKSGTLSDVEVTTQSLISKPSDCYRDIPVTATVDLPMVNQTAVANQIFVVDDISKAVVSMADSRWTGYTVDSSPKFTVDVGGKAVVTKGQNNSTGLSVLNAGSDNGKYGNFYVEYVLEMTKIPVATNNSGEPIGYYNSYYYSYFSMANYGNITTNVWQQHQQFDGRTSGGTGTTCYTKLIDIKIPDIDLADIVYDYKEVSAKDGYVEPVTVAMLVYDNTISVYIDGIMTATYTSAGTADYEGWFGIQNYNMGGTMTIDHFIYVPLSKQVTDFTVKAEGVEVTDGTIIESMLYDDLEVSVIPYYSWPFDKGEETADNIEITGFNDEKRGQQTVTVTYGGHSKEITVKVVDINKTVISENFEGEENPFDDENQWTGTSGVVIDNGKVLMNGQTSAATKSTFTDGYLEAKIAITEWTAESDGTIYATKLSRTITDIGSVNVQFAVTKTGEEYVAQLQTFVYEVGENNDDAIYTENPVVIDDFVLGNEYTVRLTCVGNYVEVRIDNEIKVQYTLKTDSSLIQTEGRFGFGDNAGITSTLDDLVVVEYTAFTMNRGVYDGGTVSLQEYSVFGDDNNTSTRTAFYAGENIVLTVKENVGKQLAAVKGLYYNLQNSTTDYVITERLGGVGENREICNQFVLQMPMNHITLHVKCVNEGKLNFGVKGVSIREQMLTDEGVKDKGIRFSSRAYLTYTTEDTNYTLEEYGTLIFKQGEDAEQEHIFTENMLQACYDSANGIYKEGDNTIGKKMKATRMQDICDEYVDWSLVLTYADDSLVDSYYSAFSYVRYIAENGESFVSFSEEPVTYSYNEVIRKLGYEIQPQKTYLFYDAFTTGHNSEWVFSKSGVSTYVVEDEVLNIHYTGNDVEGTIGGTVNCGNDWTNYAVSMDVTLSTDVTDSSGSVGVYARRSSNGYRYDFRLVHSSDTITGVLYRFSSDGTTTLAKFTEEQLLNCVGETKGFGRGITYNMRIEVRGNMIRCYLDDVALPIYKDDSEYALTSGTVGFMAVKSDVTLDNFTVLEKDEQPIQKLLISEVENNTIELYEGFDVDLPAYTLKVLDEDGTYYTTALTKEMISEFDNTVLGEQKLTITYEGFLDSATVVISERPEVLATFENAVTSASVADAETIAELKEQYDGFSPYELSKIDVSILGKYEEMVETYERAKDTNLEGYELLWADAMNDDSSDTWNASTIGSSANWISLNGTLYEAQEPYNLSIDNRYSPNVSGEIYSISADITMLSTDMYVGVSMNLSQSGYYAVRVFNTGRDDNGQVIYSAHIQKRNNAQTEYLKGISNIPLELGTKFNLRLTLKDGILTAYINDVELMKCNDGAGFNQHTRGTCEIFALYGDSLFDNVRIYGKAIEQPEKENTIKATSFVDDFEDEAIGSNPNYWVENNTVTTEVDNWQIYERNNTFVYGTEVTEGYTETWLHVFEKNPIFTTKFMVGEIGANGEIGFITRRSPDTAYVNIGYDFEERKWYIASQESEAGGCEVFWAETATELIAGQWYTASVNAVGKTVTLSIDGEEVLTSENIKRTGFGKLGFYTNHVSMYVDDINYRFPYGDIPQNGIISYVIEPEKYSHFMEIESTDGGNTLIGVGSTRKLSTDAGVTWTNVTSDSFWADLPINGYQSILERNDGSYIQVVGGENYAVKISDDLQNWTTIGYIGQDEDMADAAMHLNSLTEFEIDGQHRLFIPIAFRTYNSSGNVSGHYTKIYYSDTDGYSWKCSETTTQDLLPGYSTSTTWAESKVIRCSDGSLRMYYSRNYLGCMQYTESTDGGVTWSGLKQIPYLQCAMTSYAIIEDPTERGTYYMIWINGEAECLGSMTPRVRPCLLKSTDGKNWEFLMNCEYMTEFNSTLNGASLYQILDPSLHVTEDYVYITFGRSEREYSATSANNHQEQRTYYLRVQKEQLETRKWDASTIANVKYPETITIATNPQTTFAYGNTFTLAGGKLKVIALDGTLTYEDMTENCYVYDKPDMTAAGIYGTSEQTIQVYYANGQWIGSYIITVKGRLGG